MGDFITGMQASATTANINYVPPQPEKVVGSIPEGERLNVATAEMPTGTRQNPFKHTHGPNFGRFVEGCPKCAIEWPQGAKGPRVYMHKERKERPLKREPNVIVVQAPKAEARTEPGLTREEVMNLLREQAPIATNSDTLAKLVELMLAKESKTLAKEQAEELRKLAAREDMIRVVKEQQAMVARNQANCGHVKENGRTAVNGQIHNDGYYHPFCQRCFKSFPKRRPTNEEMPTAVS